MTRHTDRVAAINLRKQGMSYSQIKQQLGVSKSTLSLWLRDMPLSVARINQLRAHSEQRIEKFRETMRKKKDERRARIYEKVAKEIRKSNDTTYLAGFYLYWGEGTKTAEYTVSLTNSDPAMVRNFVDWLKYFDVDRGDVRAKLHLYTDQNEQEMKLFWSQALGIPIQNFTKTYRKPSRADRKTYKGMFSYGTCVVAYHDRDVYEYVMAALQYIRSQSFN